MRAKAAEPAKIIIANPPANTFYINKIFILNFVKELINFTVIKKSI